MKLDKEPTIPVNGYIIKNLVCQTSTFKVCDAIDINGNSFVLKIIPADIKVNLLKEEHVIESFVHNDKLFIVYAENNFAKEGQDYFSYYMDESSSSLSIDNNNNNNNLTSAGTGIISPLLDNEKKNTTSTTTRLCFDDISMISHLKKKKMFGNISNSCSNRLRTPIPKNCNFILPGTPESDISLSEEETDSECDSNDSFDDDDDEDDEEEEEEEDGDGDDIIEVVTPINKKLDESVNNELIPILKSHSDDDEISNMISTDNFSNNNTSPIHKKEPNYVSQPSHIHIQCPLTRIIHSKHTTIRKTPIPREMLLNNNNNNDDTSFQFKQNKTRTNTSCGEPFKLEMVKSSMLRRRSSTKCQFST
ncbi:similar to Saccharomyces cerevisiae YPR005C HAL1 Cytoplasmic protein involved in halotolerance [Maudiozyma saulgeensis]|uniref:Similar to Saccharomyces cerevisiae YPR005C HAL1 Cytoplasmic protein involved in halotolerance n=1 Tax=Maudiozyma saulgeensis TaxID=1789683 RepID=A0A1X7R0I1_9SACH|nr:similar to Saccharomyces cerevisiae YPR005C HAL1 Cytoplasmic protein involved in halotolerance [Kazachstania saulgeensis]